MVYGKKKNLKGKKRVFTAPDKIDKDLDESESGSDTEKKEKNSDESSSEEESSDDEIPQRSVTLADVAPKAEVYEVKGNWNQLQVPSDSESDYSSSSEDDMYNPTQMKGITKKAGAIDLNAKPQLSRREREEIEKQRDARRYQQLHAAGKTDEAQSDMARLEQIRKKRAEDAARRAMYEDDKEEEIANKKKALKGKK